MIKKGWLLFFIVVLLIAIFFNIRFLGFGVYNQTPSNVTVTIPNSPPVIEDINDTLYVCEGNKLSHYFLANDSDGDVLEGWITPQNPFFVFWVSQTNPNTHRFVIVSGTLDKGDLGGVNVGSKTYKETVYVDDNWNSTCCYDTEQVNITVIEINNPPSIEDVGVKTIWNQGENSTFYEVVDVSDIEYDRFYGNFIFNITILNSSGQQVDLFNISNGGVINFTANVSTPLGVYNVTVCVQDTGLSNTHPNITDYCGQTGAASSDCDSFSLTITQQNRAPNITNYYPETLNFSAPGTQTLFFNITKYDPDGTIPDTYWYLNGSLIEKDSGSSVDNLSYTFGCDVSGNYTFKAEITDGELNDSVQWNVSISQVSCPSPPGPGGGGGVEEAVEQVLRILK